MIRSKLLAEISGLSHAFFTREGGASKGIYQSLNCGQGSDDDANTVQSNRATAMKSLQLSQDRLCTVWQHHGTTAVVAEQPIIADEKKPADALVTETTTLALGILTADCAPVLIADPEARVAAAVHCGWKGALKGVISNSVDEMKRLGADPSRMVAAIGPCIGFASYEVGEEFRAEFAAESMANTEYFYEGENGRLTFDLSGFVASRLRMAGIESVDAIGQDTYADERRFFSYRRTCHRGEPDYGRQLAAIAWVK
jgi:YfiH family protein